VTFTLSALADLAEHDANLREELLPVLRRHRASERRSIATRARTLLEGLE
jgi:hypothetical protein